MANEEKKDFNAMLHDSKDMPKYQTITDQKSIEKYGGDRMYFAPPIDYDRVMRQIPYGKVITVGKIREHFARMSGADFTEPITAGIFVSIAAWASHQRSGDETPYWRTLKANGELNAKYPGGVEAQKEKLEAEGHTIVQKGRKNIRYYVKDYEKVLFELDNSPAMGSDCGKRDSDIAWEEVSTEHIVQDEWIDFRKSDYRFPDGRVIGPFYTYSRRDYVVIVASDTEGNYLCVRQFRQGIKEVTTEFPAGGIERKDGGKYGSEGASVESALMAAKRELLEETGYESDEWAYLLTVPSNATISDNYAYLFAAKNCRKVSGQSLDEMEFINVKKFKEQEIDELIASGEFKQAMHIAAWFLERRGN